MVGGVDGEEEEGREVMVLMMHVNEEEEMSFVQKGRTVFRILLRFDRGGGDAFAWPAKRSSTRGVQVTAKLNDEKGKLRVAVHNETHFPYVLVLP